MSFKELKSNINELESLLKVSSKKICEKAIIEAVVIVILISLPFLFLLISLFKQFINVPYMFTILTIVAGIFLIILSALITFIYYQLLSNLIQDKMVIDKLKLLPLKKIFLKELLSPILDIIIFVIILLINIWWR